MCNVYVGVDGTGLLIDNLVDWRRADNQELVMRLETDVKSGEDFSTDLNGFQMTRRKTRSKLPLQANYYPMPSMAYLQDDDSRMTLIGRQPVGVASLQSGQLEVILERRLMQDDNRGLFQGVTDNMVTHNSFALLLERRTKDCVGEADDPQASYPSLLAVASRHTLMAPYHRLIWTQSGAAAASLSKNYEPMDKDMACDINIVSLRTMQSNAFKQVFELLLLLISPL